MREIIKAEPAVRARRDADGRGARRCSPTSRTRRDHRARRRPAAADDADAPRSASGGTISVYRNTDPFVDMCRGPHVPSTGRLGHFKLHARGRRLLAGQREGPDAAAHLRHGLGVQEGRSPSTCTGSRRPRSATTASSAAELDLFSLPRGARRRAWPCGTPRARIVRKLMEDYRRLRHEHGGYEFVYTPHIANGEAVRDVAVTSTGTPTACTRRWRWTTATYYLKPMNCPFHMPDLPSPAAPLPRAAAAAVRARHGVPLRDEPARCTA